MKSAADAPVLVVTTSEASAEHCAHLRLQGVEVLTIDSDGMGRPDLTSIARDLGRRRMTNVLVEGGSQVLGAFFDGRLIDEVHAFISPKLVGGVTAPTPISGLGLDSIPNRPSLDEPAVEILDGDIYLHGPVLKE